MASNTRPLAIVTGATTVASVTPAGVLAEMHRREAEPGSGDEPGKDKAEGKSTGS